MTTHLFDINATLAQLGACPEARDWVASQEGSAYNLWRCCNRGNWLLWLAARVNVDRRLVVLAACDCAEVALVHMPDGEYRPRIAIDMARRWARGEATIEEVAAAADATLAFAADAAFSAYAATHTVHDAAYAADAAAHAATAAYAASTANYADARAASLAHSAQLVRARISWSVVRDALKTLNRGLV